MARKIDTEAQAHQFKLMAEALLHQLRERANAEGHRNRRRATVFTILRHASRSGMRRIIDLVVIDAEGDTLRLSLVGADAYRYDYNRDGYVVDGCGMDMGFALVDGVMRPFRRWCEDNGYADLAVQLRDWQDAVEHRWL